MADPTALPPPARLAGMQRFNPLAQVRARFQHWWQARLRASDTLLLHQRNVYILPTVPGWMLAATLLLLLVASINFQLNLGYLLTFLLAGSAAAGMHVAHANLRGLTLHLLPPVPCFAGSAAALEVQLSHSRRSPRYAIGLAVLDSGHWAWSDVPAQGSATLQVSFRPPRRGLHAVPVLSAETRFPLGTFRVWTVWRPAAQLLVYPAVEPHAPPLPPAAAHGDDHSAARGKVRAAGEYDGLRPYQRGDPMKLVVWKKAAKAMASGSDELVSRDSEQPQRHDLWLDHAATSLADFEARLSRLSAWVVQAERLGLDYGLRLPGREIAPGNGTAHYLQCMEALALC